jgi:hypothetical protein
MTVVKKSSLRRKWKELEKIGGDFAEGYVRREGSKEGTVVIALAAPAFIPEFSRCDLPYPAVSRTGAH